MLNFKVRLQKEWIIHIIELVLISCTFLASLVLFRDCDCCFITKVVVHLLLFSIFLASGVYLIFLSNESHLEKIIKILIRFQNLKLIVFLILVGTWIMLSIISFNSLKICGIEKGDNFYINNSKNTTTLDSSFVNLLKNSIKSDTVMVKVEQKHFHPIYNTNKYITNKKDTLKIIKDSSEILLQKKYITVLNEINKKLSEAEKKTPPTVKKIEIKKLKLTRNKYSNKDDIFKQLESDSVDIKAQKLKSHKNEIYITP